MNKLVVSKSALYAALKVVSPVIQSRAVIPMMQNVKVIVKGTEMTFIGSDFSTTIVHGGVGCDFDSEIEFMVEFEHFFKVVSTLPSAPVSISVNDKTITINKEFKIGLDSGVENYPKVPELENPIDVEFTNEQYSAILTASKFVFNGKEPDAQALLLQNISIRADSGYLDVFATNRHKGFFHRSKLIDKNISFWSRVAGDTKLPDISNMPKISFSEDRIKIAFGDTEIYSMLSVQKYPEYWKPFKKPDMHNIVIDSKDLSDALDAANALKTMGYTDGDYKVILIKFSKNKANISYQNVDFNQSFSRDIKCTTEVEGDIRLNLSNLMTVLKSISQTEELKIFYNGGKMGASIWENDEEHYTVLPLVY